MDKELALVFRLIDQVSKPLKQIQSALKATLGVGTAFNKIQKSLLSSVGGSILGIGKAAVSAATSLRTLAGVLAGLLAVRMITSTFMATAESMDRISKMARSLDVSTRFLSEFSGGARLMGISVELVDSAMQRLNVAIGQARTEGGAAAELFRRLGVDIRGSTEEVLTGISEELSRISDASERARLATLLFGQQAGPKLLELIGQGSRGLAELRAEAEKFGLSISETAGRRAEEFGDSIKAARLSIQGIANTITSEFMPIITPFLQTIAEEINKNREAIAKWVSGWATFENVLGLVIGFTRGLVVAMALAKQAIGSVTLTVAMLGLWITKLLLVVDQVSGFILNSFKLIYETAKFTINAALILVILPLLDHIEGGVKYIVDLVQYLIAKGSGLALTAKRNVLEAVEGVVLGVSAMIEGLASRLSRIPVFEGMADSATQASDAAKKSISEMVESARVDFEQFDKLNFPFPTFVKGASEQDGRQDRLQDELREILATINETQSHMSSFDQQTTEALKNRIALLQESVRISEQMVLQGGMDGAATQKQLAYLDGLRIRIAEVKTAYDEAERGAESFKTTISTPATEDGTFVKLKKNLNDIHKQTSEVLVGGFNSLKGAATDAFRGVLDGSMNAGDALRQFGQAFVSTLISMVAQMVITIGAALLLSAVLSLIPGLATLQASGAAIYSGALAGLMGAIGVVAAGGAGGGGGGGASQPVGTDTVLAPSSSGAKSAPSGAYGAPTYVPSPTPAGGRGTTVIINTMDSKSFEGWANQPAQRKTLNRVTSAGFGDDPGLRGARYAV